MTQLTITAEYAGTMKIDVPEGGDWDDLDGTVIVRDKEGKTVAVVHKVAVVLDQAAVLDRRIER